MSSELSANHNELVPIKPKKTGIRTATVEIVPKDSPLMESSSTSLIKKKLDSLEIKKKKQVKKKTNTVDIRKFFGISTLDDTKNVLIPVKPGKIIYEKKLFDLGDGAKCTYIPGYVRNPDALFNELKEKISWGVYTFEAYDREVQSPRLISVIHFDKDDTSDLPELNKIKTRVEKFTGLTFRYAVCNYYRDGNDYIMYHSDNENSNGNNVISITVGDTRKFVLKHKFRKDVKFVFQLKHGDVLILNDEAIRKIYRHGIPKQANAEPRINVTLRE